MSIRNLDSLFAPSSVAVFGASPRPASVGGTVWSNLRSGDFEGPILAVNPKYRSLGDEPVHARASHLPCVPELAVICTPPDTVAGLIDELGRRGTRAAVVLTAGLDAAQKQAMLAAARPHLLRILGPNCVGLLVPHLGLNASFAHAPALPGELAFVSQSGALITAMLDWSRARGIGFSHFVSLGEHADVDFGDMLDYLASDPKTRAILLYIESIESPRKFMSAARAAARNKPVIVVKAGRSHQGQRAAASHTGALAGSDLVYDAAIARAGMLRVDTMQQLFLAAETLTRLRGNRCDELTILTNGGGAGVMAADAASHARIKLAELDPRTLERLDALLPANWSHGNPVDIIGDAPVERYVRTLEALGDDEAAGAVLFIHAPSAIVPSADIARALLPLAANRPARLLSCWLGEEAVDEARRLFRQAGLATYDTPEDAVRAFAMLVAYRRNQAQLLEAPPAGTAIDKDHRDDTVAARALIAAVLAEGRTMLTEPEAKAVLAAYGIAVVATRSAGASPEEAARVAAEIGLPAVPVALKILSPDISHKSDVGGVVLDLASEREVQEAAAAMLERVARERPQARIDGFTVQAMLRRRHAHELIVGASIDPVFGPVILFGHGGTAVELVADRAVALPPLNAALARALVQRTRIARLLGGWRDTPAADQEALHRVLVAVSRLLADLGEVAELDINPLVLSPEGAVALDARLRVQAPGPGGAASFAIRPYPDHWIERVDWQGRALTLRPIRPEDEAQHLAFLQRLEPQDIRLRIFHSRRSIERSELARLTQIDYDRELAFVAEASGPDGRPETLGAVRAVTDPDNVEAEFGIIVRSDLKGSGLGALLMDKLLRALREHGTRRVVATVLTENDRMRGLARRFGFVEGANAAEGVRAIALDLAPAAGAPP
ncbi:bifunctional acetate--CoA ligase family protein/GNAT family N-acetyltransferase [Methylibium petroleiphilum]|uniref:bifunctional acetate--CoA ligase family protein/GNAT family N-acetyltransferase n=1 Tax=Methylibium petroleiphilum TaxID=105560 RepID=UPI001AC32BC0|nr:bifunctional acetate--CoA ligase family protein/GNAT family N-acetyltransferase [Methylibium petroleiphilum]MBN9203681.1 bifunctional acetate--CoA ligase family protein/GNAT family N-acetyltransferase [Methylibium petroleiphilum]